MQTSWAEVGSFMKYTATKLNFLFDISKHLLRNLTYCVTIQRYRHTNSSNLKQGLNRTIRRLVVFLGGFNDRMKFEESIRS